jgi:hypothetical protein
MDTLKLHVGGCTLAAHDWEFVTRLMEGAGESLRLRGEIAMLPHWIQALTESAQRSHPASASAIREGSLVSLNMERPKRPFRKQSTGLRTIRKPVIPEWILYAAKHLPYALNSPILIS